MPEKSKAEASIPSSRATLLVTAVALLFVVMPVLFWHGTWFGKDLTDEQISEYLADRESPRQAQHALAQLSQRITAGDPSVKQWYPRVVSLAGHPVAQIRLTAAWVMGQDAKHEEFHQALLVLIGDEDPLVARNAALSLAGFGDSSGRDILRAMLRPSTVTSPRAGVLSYRLQAGDVVDQDTLLARLTVDGEAEPVEIRSILPGVVNERLLEDGVLVRAGQEIMALGPSSDHVFQALRALFLVGTREDLDDVRRFLTPRDDMPSQIHEQARLTVDEIRNRSQL